MKRLFSKAMLVALMISLMPAQSAQANDAQRIKNLCYAVAGLSSLLLAQEFRINSMVANCKAGACSAGNKSAADDTQVVDGLSKKTRKKFAYGFSLASWLFAGCGFYYLYKSYIPCVS